MNTRTSLACAFAFVCLSTSAWAQSDQRGFVQDIGGMTFGTEAAPIFGGGFGVNVAPNFQITGEFGTMRDILPGWIQDAADDAALDVERLILLFLGERIDVGVDANAPAFYGMGGGRFVARRAAPPGRLSAPASASRTSHLRSGWRLTRGRDR